MSITFGKGDILFEQRLLACGGFYTDRLDSKWGKNSEKAAKDAESAYLAIRQNLGAFDTRSEGNIATLLPAMQKKARLILKVGAEREKATGLKVSILSGTRTYAEQNGLFNQRPKVTNARGGYSNHNFGIAIDVGLFKAGKYFTGANRAEEKAYADFAAAVKAAVTGVEWGGDWQSFKDAPHYQFKTGLTTTQTREKFEAGKLVLV